MHIRVVGRSVVYKHRYRRLSSLDYVKSNVRAFCNGDKKKKLHFNLNLVKDNVSIAFFFVARGGNRITPLG